MPVLLLKELLSVLLLLLLLLLLTGTYVVAICVHFVYVTGQQSL